MRAAELDPRSVRYQYLAARALQGSGQTEESLIHLNRLETLKPDHKDALFLLGWAHQKAGRLTTAIDIYPQFLRTHPQHVQARLNLAIALRTEKNCKEAIAQLNRVLELAPENKWARTHLEGCQNEAPESAKGQNGIPLP